MYDKDIAWTHNTRMSNYYLDLDDKDLWCKHDTPLGLA